MKQQEWGFTECQRKRLITYHNGKDGNRVFNLERASLKEETKQRKEEEAKTAQRDDRR
jgi:hypothetical protein